MGRSRARSQHNHSRSNAASSRYFSKTASLQNGTFESSWSQGLRSSQDATPSSALPAPKRRQTPHSFSSSLQSPTPNIAHSDVLTSISRPTTASGRKSRATNASSVLGLGEAHTIVCAVCEARGVSPSVGIAFVNTSLGEAVLSQICDNQSYVKTLHKIRINWPSRIVCLSQSTQSSNLVPLLCSLFNETPIDQTDRACWSEAKGLEYIQRLAFESDIQPIQVALQGKYYAVCALAAAMAQVEHQFSITFAPHSLRLRYQPSDDTMMIDISALQCLEILGNNVSSKSKDSLFGLLNHTTTPMGKRMLRSNILQPPTLYESFMAPRYDAVDELTANDEMFLEIRKSLKRFLDVEKLLTKLITVPTITDISKAEQQINQVLMIKSFLEAAKDLNAAMLPASTPLLLKIRDLCDIEKIAAILQKINCVMEPDVIYTKSPLDLRNQRTFAVRSGISGILDVSRQAYKELTEEIHCYVEKLSETHRIAASLKFDNGRKYWLRLTIGDYNSVEPRSLLINVAKKRGAVECQTLDLVKLNMRLSDTSNEVVFRSDAIIEQVVVGLQADASHLFKMCEAVGLLDMLASFAHVSSTRDYVKPEFTSRLALKSARHPILDRILEERFVANDYFAAEQHCFHIVTGFNMGGKSTYIRGIALLQIMAQIGCFVPAEYASFSVVHNIFTRISLHDNVEAGLSSFSVEMRDMAFILRNVDEKSMVIIDELGRGTSTRDGLAIAIAMAEALIQSKAFVWFATHFLDLARVLGNRPGVLNLHLATDCSMSDDGTPHITMLYKTERGPESDEQNYGINLAKAIGLPGIMIQKAEEFVRQSRLRKEATRQTTEAQKIQKRRQLMLGLQEALGQARVDGAEEALPGYLRQLQQEFITQMAKIEEGE